MWNDDILSASMNKSPRTVPRTRLYTPNWNSGTAVTAQHISHSSMTSNQLFWATTSRKYFLCTVIFLSIIVSLFLGSIKIGSYLSPVGQTVLETVETCGPNDGIKHEIEDSLAFCIDGTKPAYYFRKGSGDGVNKWNLFFEGGGWCYSLDSCIRRMKYHTGSSRNYPQCLRNDHMKFYQSGDKSKNPLMHNWNTVHIKYCDGSSYAGDATVAHKNHVLHFTGKHNRDAFVNTLLSQGMASASSVVISGCSAGALGIYLGLDDMAAKIREVNPTVKIRGMADSGYFMDYTANENYVRRNYHPVDEAFVDNLLDFAGLMRQVYVFANISAGADLGCLDKQQKPGVNRRPSNCIFAKYLITHVTTPVFAIQPVYDQWQIWNVMGNPSNYSLINSIGRQIKSQMLSNLLNRPQHGVFFDACSHHCTSCSDSSEDSWHGSNVLSSDAYYTPNVTISPGGKTPAQAFTEWYEDEAIDALSLTELSQKYDQTMTRSRHINIQAFEYPCDHCCRCRVLK